MSGRALSLLAVVTAFGGVATACTGAQTPQCAPGQFYDENLEQCSGGATCPPGTAWNGQACAPPQVQQCPAGQAWNGAMCVASATPQCPAGLTWNGAQCVPLGLGGGSSCTPAQALDPVAGAAATQALGLLAQQKAPGMSPTAGGAVSGNFQAGQCLEAQITLNPGKCYTAVATGLGPSEVNIELAPALPGPLSQPIAQDQTSGPMAVLGESPNCFRWAAPIPAPMKLILKVPAGAGPAAVQLFEK